MDFGKIVSKQEKSAHKFFLISIYLVVIALICYVGKFLLNVFLARHLSPGLYGDFSIGWRTFGLLAILLLLGTGTASKRFLPTLLKDKKQVAEAYVSWNFRFVVRACLAFIIFLAIFSLTLVLLHLYNVKSIDSYHLAIYMLFLAPLGAFAALLASYLQCNQNNYWSSFLASGGRYFVLVGLLLTSIYFLELSFDKFSLWILVLLTFVVLSLLEMIMVLVKLPVKLRFQLSRFRKDQSQERELWSRTSFRLMTSQAIFLVMSVTDLYLVELLVKNETAVDKYAAVLTVCGVLWLLSLNIYRFIAARVSTAMESGQFARLRKMIWQASLVNLFVCGGVVAIIIIFRATILSSFSAHYVTTQTELTMIILALGCFLGSFSKPAIFLLAYAGGEKQLINLSIIEFASLLILGVPLTLWLGIVGTAIATAGSILIKSLQVLIASRKILRAR
jgi:O-antigen/teichoic acid export membrane protein